MKKLKSKHIRLDLSMLAITFGIHTLIEILLTVNSILWTNTLYRETVFPDIFTTAQSLLDLAVISAGYSLIAVAFFMGQKKTACIFTYVGATVYRRALAVGITFIINGTVALDDIVSSVMYLIIDLIILVVAIFIIHLFSKNYRRKIAMASKASALFGDRIDKNDVTSIYPFTKIYGRGNPLQSCLLALSILPSAVNAVSRTCAIMIQAPDSILMTVAGYVGDVLGVIVSYALACFLLSWLYSMNERRLAISKIYGEN